MADRTEAEREAARVERERRRAEREGTDAPAAPEPRANPDRPVARDEGSAEYDGAAPAYDDEGPVYEDEAPAGPEPLVPPEPAAASSSTDDFEVFASRANSVTDAGVIVDHPAVDDHDGGFDDHDDGFDDHDDGFDDHDDGFDDHDDGFDDHDGGSDDHDDGFDDHDNEDHDNGGEGAHPDELPAGTRRISALQRKPAKRKPVRRNAARGMGRRHSLRGRIGGLLALIVGVALIWFLLDSSSPSTARRPRPGDRDDPRPRLLGPDRRSARARRRDRLELLLRLARDAGR